jgi:alanine racemase
MLLYQTHAVVHLNSIKHNIDGIRTRVGANRKILLAVKANAYGHGAVAVSRMAENAGVDWLGVATVPEGIELRQSGISLPILKFSPAFPQEMAAALAHGITLTVCDLANARALDEVARQTKKKVSVHIKVDTGMGRIGVAESQAEEFASLLRKQCLNLRVEGIFTHLPVSDEPQRDNFTRKQLSKFEGIVRRIQATLGYDVPLLHAANSGGILAHEASWLSMVRPGIMLYGFLPGGDTPPTVPLKPAMSLFTKVSFVKFVKAGTPIGYGGSWIAPRDTHIATIPAGYADGFNRLFSNCGHALLGGQRYPIVGRVCMDQSMIDLGPSTTVKVGDKVTLIGKDGAEEITVNDWAKMLKTITYEVTCQINARVPRIFEDNGLSPV